jgi:hypothetical protein
LSRAPAKPKNPLVLADRTELRTAGGGNASLAWFARKPSCFVRRRALENESGAAKSFFQKQQF